MFKKLSLLPFAFCCIFFFSGCGDDDEPVDDKTGIPLPPSTPLQAAGASYTQSSKTFDQTYADLKASIQANANVSIVAEVDHKATAQSVNLTLRPTKLIIFGNPVIGTPIMQADRLAALDLPQKMLVMQGADDSRFVLFNGTEYLVARHNVSGASTIGQLNTALTNFAQSGSGGTVTANPSTSIGSKEGVVTVPSNNDFASTYQKLRDAIAGNPNLTIIAEVDHMANAQSAGLTLDSTKLIIFGNPALGTPLMQSAQTTALDLPQKMLVWRQSSDGSIKVSYNDPQYLKGRHGITGQDMVLTQISGALQGLANTASN